MSKGRRKQADRRPIWCCACNADVQARLTDGSEVYPSRSDLDRVPFWLCDTCRGHVGTHHRHHVHAMRMEPLGIIPTPEIRNARKMIHRILDPLWQRGGGHKRRHVYAEIAKRMGWPSFHTAELRSIEDARAVYRIVRDIQVNGLDHREAAE